MSIQRRRGLWKSYVPKVAGAVLLLAGMLAAPLASGEEPSRSAKLFAKKCGSCHTIGDGDRQGPDLLGVTKRRSASWLKRFIRTPGALIDSGDPVATQLLAKFKDVRMPDQPLGDLQLEEMIAYLTACGAKGGCKLALGKIRHASDAKPAHVATGRAIFEGERPLSKGGASCLSCHNVRGIGVFGGGTLGKDLTHVYARLGDKGLHAALENTPFAVMKDIYAKRPLSSDEVFALKAFLADVSKSGEHARRDYNFIYLGVLGLFLALGAIGFIWSSRMRGVRSTIVKRGEP